MNIGIDIRMLVNPLLAYQEYTSGKSVALDTYKEIKNSYDLMIDPTLEFANKNGVDIKDIINHPSIMMSGDLRNDLMESFLMKMYEVNIKKADENIDTLYVPKIFINIGGVNDFSDKHDIDRSDLIRSLNIKNSNTIIVDVPMKDMTPTWLIKNNITDWIISDIDGWVSYHMNNVLDNDNATVCPTVIMHTPPLFKRGESQVEITNMLQQDKGSVFEIQKNLAAAFVNISYIKPILTIPYYYQTIPKPQGSVPKE